MANFSPEMLKYSAEINEEINHIFGYAKDDREDNTTPFVDYEGKARPESIAKTNYYKELNELNWKKRMAVPHGCLPEAKIDHTEHAFGVFNMISHMQVLQNYKVCEYMDLSGV